MITTGAPPSGVEGARQVPNSAACSSDARKASRLSNGVVHLSTTVTVEPGAWTKVSTRSW